MFKYNTMPNHVKNLLTIEGEDNLVKFVFDVIHGNKENQFIDFNKIIPAPAFCFNKCVGSREEEIANKFNTPIWTNFNRNKWGTKWNAYSQNKVSDNQLEFQTAWTAPKKIVQAISSQFPSLKITLKYADEDTGSNTGILVWNHGLLESYNYPESQSHEAYSIYFELNPEDRDNYEFIDGKYEYVDNEE